MNMNAPISFEAALKARYAATRARIIGAGMKANDNQRSTGLRAVKTNHIADPEPAKDRPSDNHHVAMYRVWLLMTGGEIDATEAVKALCVLNGTTLEDIKGSRQRGRFIMVKKAIIRSIYHRFHPGMSTSMIGRIFGCNHETILYHVGRTQRGKAMMEKEGLHKSVYKTPAKKQRMIYAEWLRTGASQAKLRAKFGVSETTIRRIIKDYHSGSENHG